MKFINIVLSLFAASTFAAPANNQVNPREVYIESVTWNGSGCRMGSSADTNYQISDDRRAITIIYSNYIAQAGGGATPAAGRKNCLINFKLHVPNRWQFTVSQTTFHGFADMGGACNGWVQASYWFTGTTQRVSFIMPLYIHQNTDRFDRQAVDIPSTATIQPTITTELPLSLRSGLLALATLFSISTLRSSSLVQEMLKVNSLLTPLIKYIGRHTISAGVLVKCLVVSLLCLHLVPSWSQVCARGIS